MSVALDYRNTNSLWCSVLVETWFRCGVRQAVCCPGSRSTPVTMALAAHRGIEAIPVLDERSAGFFALGLAKASGVPVVLVCTSGSAGANFFPAVIEAHESGVPLLVVTADRPPEMRECASGQTIDQQKLFGSHVAWYHEFAVPELKDDLLRYLRQTALHAYERALAGGPVHLNAPFRDPLAPIAEAGVAERVKGLDETFFAHLGAPVPCVSHEAVLRPTTQRGLIVAGPYVPRNDEAFLSSLLAFSETTGWPVLADVLSPVRRSGKLGTRAITAYDAILRNEAVAAALVPKTVFCLGGWPTSKVLRGWLERSQAEVVLVSPTVSNKDALHGKTRHLPLAPEDLRVEAGVRVDPAYAALWAGAEAKARAVLDAALYGEKAFFEPVAAWLLARHLPVNTSLMVANSMPVRDLEYVWPLREKGPRVFFNRGANGIDGNLSTAFGVAHGRAPAVLFTGDLALFHDSNGFLLRPQFRGSLTVVLINNRGGGIFGHLPVAQFEPPFEKYFATPQEVNVASLCAAHEVSHEVVSSWEMFASRISALPAQGVRVLEVVTDRTYDARARKTLFAAAAAAVSS